MNGWLTRCRRESVNRARKFGVGGQAHSLSAAVGPSWSNDRHDGVSKARIWPIWRGCRDGHLDTHSGGLWIGHARDRGDQVPRR
jgi:hypothetical protein